MALRPLVSWVVKPHEIPGLGYSGVLGLEDIALYNWRLDYKNRRVAAKPRTVNRPNVPLVGYTAFHKDGHITVTGLIEQGAADRAGVQLGDRILSLNGHHPGTFLQDDYFNTLLCACSDAYVFEIERDGMKLILIAPQKSIF